MTDFAAIRSRAEATGRRGWTVFVHHARTDVLALLDAVEERDLKLYDAQADVDTLYDALADERACREERDRTIETLTAALREANDALWRLSAASSPAEARAEARLAYETVHAALASVPQHDQGADHED